MIYTFLHSPAELLDHVPVVMKIGLEAHLQFEESRPQWHRICKAWGIPCMVNRFTNIIATLNKRMAKDRLTGLMQELEESWQRRRFAE